MPARLSRYFILILALLSTLSANQASYSNEPLTIGIFPRRNAAITIQYFHPIADYLSKRLQRPVQIETSKDFASFWKNVADRRYDVVHYNQYHYVDSSKRFGYEVILKNEEFGKKRLSGAILVRRDSGIEKLTDLRGRKILFGGGPKAMVSYIAARHLLRKAGLKDDEYDVKFAKNPPNACMGTYLKQADAAGVGDIILNLPLIKKRVKTEQMKFIAISEPLPHIPWAVKNDMPDALKNSIQTILSTLHETDAGKKILQAAKLTRLHTSVDKDYDVARKIINEFSGTKY